jgi:hypothetical protein
MHWCHPVFVSFIRISLVDMTKDFEEAIFGSFVIKPGHF